MAHQTRPFIGINADFIPASKVTGAHTRVNIGYVDAVLAAGGLPIVLPPLGKEIELDVLLEPHTRIDEIYGGGELRVNSAHHQAVNQVGSRLRVGARAPDGIIEAIEAVDPNWFCVGVQWHPESETASALDMQLFECFIQACVRQAQPLQLAA